MESHVPFRVRYLILYHIKYERHDYVYRAEDRLASSEARLVSTAKTFFPPMRFIFSFHVRCDYFYRVEDQPTSRQAFLVPATKTLGKAFLVLREKRNVRRTLF